MNARALNVLHNTGDKNVCSVGYYVDLKLGSHHILIDKHRIFNAARKYTVHIGFNLNVIVDDTHILSAYNVRGTKQYGVSYGICRCYRFSEIHYARSDGTLDIESFKQSVKLFTVLCGVYTLSGRTKYSDTVIVEELRQLYSCLSAKRNDDAYRLLDLKDIHNVLGGERLKIQPVRGIIVGRNGFGVVVDYNNVIAKLLKRPYAVNGRIVKLDSLSYSDRT